MVFKLVGAHIMAGGKRRECEVWVLVGSLSTVLNWSAALNNADLT